jgi:hypothetical protein
MTAIFLNMKKPFLRVTQWLGTIPVEAECTSCPDAKFKVRPSSHRPNLKQYQKALQSEFDLHVKALHSREGAPESGASSAE